MTSHLNTRRRTTVPAARNRDRDQNNDRRLTLCLTKNGNYSLTPVEIRVSALKRATGKSAFDG